MIIRFIFILLSGLIVLPVAALELNWNKNSDEVDGYRIFTHPITNSTPFKAVKFGPDVLNISKNTKKVKGKSIVFFKFTEAQVAQLKPHQGVCFRLKAFNVVGTSGFSDAVCTAKKKAPTIPVGLVIIGDAQ